ncbi:type I polyketide synthase [Thermoactinospora rubra]|uniref:type I polyketide synthase n=1 Tax=Thermoactinospora rubra TaxID=1088767 RepID=UPI001F0B112D|nr:type I polyketide synthase [Thermoactinospora rubra]
MGVLSETEIRTFLMGRIGRIAARSASPDISPDEGESGVDPDRPLEEYGLSSRDAVSLAGELADLLGRQLSPTLVWEHPTINRLAHALSRIEERSAPGRRAAAEEPVAVVGVGCRVPGAHGPAELWDLLLSGRDAVGRVPEGRWEAFGEGLEATPHGGFLEGIDGFDAEFFGIAPGEARAMDPQQRILLETAWEALEHGGIAPRSLRGSRTGVFVGISANEYAYLTTADPRRIDAWTATGAAFSIAANRLSYLLDLRGPSLAVDTACSSSLVATHLAVASLRSGDSDLALAAGVNLLLSPVVTLAFDRGGGTSPDGRCKAFDASADGMVRAEGCGVVVLKRLSDALRQGDRVLAVIRATAVNQDGRSNGLVAPNPEAQEALLREVYGGLERGPDYIEAHGTGTFLGDPIEGRAIAGALDEPVLIGSVKSNLGHLEAAAGVTGLIKTVLALHHGVIPPSIHFRTPNPHLPWDRLRVVTEPTPWPRRDARAGVSSFGFGGTNAHVVLDAAPPQAPEPPPRTAKHVFVLSDVSADRVRDHAEVLAGWVDGGTPMADLAHTLARRAGRGKVAAAVVAATPGELAAKLRAVRPGPSGGAGPVWVFSGYGSQWNGMGRRLYHREPAFREAMDELAPLLKAEAGIDPWSPAKGVAQAQPAIFAVQVALARLWRAYGIEPAAVIGHSMGEVAAAVTAGGLSLADGVRVVCRRARLLGTLGGGGAMAVVEVPAAEVPSDLHVAVYSAPGRTVVTGDPHRVAGFAARVEARGLFARTLTAEGAGHSPQVKPLLPRIREELAAIVPGKPEIPYYSTVFEDPRETPVFEAAYWAAGVRRPVRLMQALQAAAEDGFTLRTEISPHPLLGLETHSMRREDEDAFHAQLEAVAAQVTPRTRGRVADMPGSPWRHTRHWAAPHRRTPGHPILGVHVETPAGHSWTTTLDDLADLPWRLDPAGWHRDGHPVLPAAAVETLAGAAAREVYGDAAPCRVRLHALLPLPARVSVTLAGDRVEVSAKDAAGVWRVYGSADLARGLAPEAVVVDETAHAPVPVRLEDKLVERVWVPSPPRGDDGPGPMMVVPRDLDVPGVERVVLDVACRAARGERVTVVTQNAQAVLDGEPARPAAALRGLVRVLAFEHPELRIRLVDVDDLGVLDRERDTGDDEVAWRDGVRYAARLRRADLPPPANLRRLDLPPSARLGRADLPPSAVRLPGPVAGPGAYLITGGYGSLGLLVARWLAERGATRIVLNGRSGPADPGALAGLPVEVVAGDLARPGTAERLVEAATAGGLRLRGVVHAAGVLDDRLVADLDPESLRRVWAPKVDGGLRLHEATRHLDLDWWVAFSSAAGLLGSPGQAAYAAANAFLDALCERRRAEGLPAISIGWGTWLGAAPLPAVEPLTPEEGIEALEALIQRGMSAGVVRLDPARAVAAFPGIARMPYFSLVAEAAPEAGQDLSELRPDEALAVVAAKLTERAAALLGFDAVWLGQDSVLTELGLDSLAATRLRGTIEHDFGVTVATAPLLRGGTLGELARAVAAKLGIAADPADGTVDGPAAGPVGGSVGGPGDGAVSGRPVGPRDAAERQVVRVLGRLLGREPGVTEAVPPELLEPVLDALGRELGRPVRASGTVADLADAVRAADEDEAERGVVRPLNAAARDWNGRDRPLFLAHPAGGTTGVYGLLAARLDVPVFGLERLEEVGVLGAELGIPERAARYAEAVRELCPGPYRLGGWSFGGVLAFELARQLGGAELVAMIDSGLPEPAAPGERRLLHARRYAAFAAYLSETYDVTVELAYEELATLDEAAQLALTEARVAESGVLGAISPAILRHQITSHEDTRALESYAAGPYQGRVVLFRSTEPTPWAVEDARYRHRDDPARGFGPFAPRLEVVEITGSHHLNLLDPPHVERLARRLREVL